VVPGKQSARKIARKRSLTVTLRSTGRVTGITAKLLRGRKSVASGRVALVDGSRKLKLKIKGKRFKAGKLTLRLTGTNPNGRKLSADFRVNIKK
jgi:hypothetical protein